MKDTDWKEVRLFLFADAMVVYAVKPKESTKMLLNMYTKCNVIIQNLVVFLNTSSVELEEEIF